MIKCSSNFLPILNAEIEVPMPKKKLAILVSQTFDDYINSLEADDFFNRYVKLFQKSLVDAGFDYSMIVIENDIPDEIWDGIDGALLNLAWDYNLNCGQFLVLLKKIEKKGIKLFNSYDTVVWNSNKTYLRDLKENGIHTIETLYVDKHKGTQLRDFIEQHDNSSFVLKPSISAAGYKTFKANSIEEAQKIYDAEYREGETVMIQPYISDVASEGEWSFMFFNSVYSHNVLKTVDGDGFKIQYTWDHTEYDGAEDWMIHSATDILKKVEEIINYVPLYARVDVVRHDDDLMVMEIELIEPFMYLFTEPAFDMYVAALKERIEN